MAGRLPGWQNSWPSTHAQPTAHSHLRTLLRTCLAGTWDLPIPPSEGARLSDVDDLAAVANIYDSHPLRPLTAIRQPRRPHGQAEHKWSTQAPIDRCGLLGCIRADMSFKESFFFAYISAVPGRAGNRRPGSHSLARQTGEPEQRQFA